MKLPRKPGPLTTDEVGVLASRWTWMSQEARLRHLEATSRDILSASADPRHDAARDILALAGQIRRGHARGWDIGGAMVLIEALVERANMAMVRPHAERGAKIAERLRAGGADGNQRRHDEAAAQHALWRRLDARLNKTLKSKQARARRIAEHLGLPERQVQNIAKKLVRRS